MAGSYRHYVDKEFIAGAVIYNGDRWNLKIKNNWKNNDSLYFTLKYKTHYKSNYNTHLMVV